MFKKSKGKRRELYLQKGKKLLNYRTYKSILQKKKKKKERTELITKSLTDLT